MRDCISHNWIGVGQLAIFKPKRQWTEVSEYHQCSNCFIVKIHSQVFPEKIHLNAFAITNPENPALNEPADPSKSPADGLRSPVNGADGIQTPEVP